MSQLIRSSKSVCFANTPTPSLFSKRTIGTRSSPVGPDFRGSGSGSHPPMRHGSTVGA